ncbi:putative nucleoside-diphosphate sugar epimerase [Leptolyngbyaceae cyanobacterium JSC-12]|nr:putative nucleoside-diphosphate sugar epimerase [Leptolyngbyaceae cyanobacterium JSC-12]
MQATLNTSSDIISRIQQLVPPGSSEPQESALVEELKRLTQALIREYQASGRLQDEPFNEAWTRSLHLYESDVCTLLHGKTVMVTGGEGCVGSRLIDKLIELGVRRIISVDNARINTSFNAEPIPGNAPNVVLYSADVRNLAALRQIFETERPAIVFHLAAIRIPGLAEKIILETVSSNIFGSQNIIQLCEEYNVEQCVFSSTGKASRYWTAEVYAATKKVNEWLFAHAAQTGNVRYSMVRFTHMLNNSSMCEQIDSRVNADRPVNIHAPERYVVGQNVGEAVHLLLNSLLFAEPKRLRFILVRNLGWPTESLEVALYKILKSGKDLPIYFQGIPPGYEEPFFLGQVDWDHPTEINTLINALETENFSTISTSGDMIVSETIPFSACTLMEQLVHLKLMCTDPSIPEGEIKQQLSEVVRQVAATTFYHASPKRVLQILKWGINLKQYERGEFYLAPYRPFIELVVQSLASRLDLDTLKECRISTQEFKRLLSALNAFPSIRDEVCRMQNIVSYFRENHPRSADEVACV